MALSDKQYSRTNSSCRSDKLSSSQKSGSSKSNSSCLSLSVNGFDGRKEWWFNGRLHRLDGPAVDSANGYKEWRLNGIRHREDGPAIEWADGFKEWYLNDKEYTEEDFLKATRPATELTVAEIEQLLGYAIKVVK